jgi:probable F420-dependent oxidoreductase, Rv2161c family
MKFGIVFPQTEIGNDPVLIRDYAQTVEGLGFNHLLAYDHVLGANPNRPGGWKGPYTHETPFHEVFVLLAFLAGVTQKIEFVTDILILPQRQTALVAKQAASLDVLSGGRLRLGVGLGWNEIEYLSLNEDFHTRGKHIEEQVDLLRKLWTKPLVDFKGIWDTVPDAGINPLSVQRPIPIWFGGGFADSALRRIARLGDGWMTLSGSAAEAKPELEKFDRYLEEAGRSRSDVGLEPRISYDDGVEKKWEEAIHAWQVEGATHLSFNTMDSGFTTPQQHLQAITAFAKVVFG